MKPITWFPIKNFLYPLIFLDNKIKLGVGTVSGLRDLSSGVGVYQPFLIRL